MLAQPACSAAHSGIAFHRICSKKLVQWLHRSNSLTASVFSAHSAIVCTRASTPQRASRLIPKLTQNKTARAIFPICRPFFCFAALFAGTEPRILTHARAFSNTPCLVALRGSVPRHSVDVAVALTHTGCIASRCYDSAFTQTRSVICTQLGFAHSSVARLFPHHGPWLCGR